MAEDKEEEIKCMVYKILTVRYKDLIAKNEEKSLSDLKQKASPFSDEVTEIYTNIVQDANNDAEKFTSILRHLRHISVVNIAIPFYLSFKDIETYKFATPVDKAILGTALLRRAGLDAKVYITRNNTYIGYNMDNTPMLLNVVSMHILQGKDADDAFMKDPLRFVFNDRYSEVFEQ